MCPSVAPPAGLAPADTPMFVLFTHDDAISAASYSALRAVLDGAASANGCSAAATLFTLARGTSEPAALLRLLLAVAVCCLHAACMCMPCMRLE